MDIKKQGSLMRGAGILLSVSSLPSPYGIGSFGQAATDFLEFLHRAGQKYWQVLPLCPTSYGDSPYQSFSAFAGNPYFIDLDILISNGLITRAEVESFHWGERPCEVDYALLYENRYRILKLAHSRSAHLNSSDFRNFCRDHACWLDEYALFMALKYRHGGLSWTDWPEPLAIGDKAAIIDARQDLGDEMDFWRFCQYHFFTQWHSVKSQAKRLGINIIGDLPIYVALDSADVWANPELFQLDSDHLPTRVAAVPLDLFSETGQLWGNPLYDWDAMEKDNFAWWRQRLVLSAELYDTIRIDHFIGIVNYYSVPADNETAIGGEWLPGPGAKLISALSNEPCVAKIIAEDLGVVTHEVEQLRRWAGYPGMRLLQMAFDSGGSNGNLPDFYGSDTVVYGGTHDNETLTGFFLSHPDADFSFAREYLDVGTDGEIPWALIRAAFASDAGVVIFQMQDYLGLDNSARMNTPSTLGSNWKWRLLKDQIPPEFEETLLYYTMLYGR